MDIQNHIKDIDKVKLCNLEEDFQDFVKININNLRVVHVIYGMDHYSGENYQLLKIYFKVKVKV